MKESTENIFGCCLFMLSILLLIGGIKLFVRCEEGKKEAADARRAFVRDSIANDHCHQESVRIIREKLDRWDREQEEIEAKSLVGFFLDGDSIYHTSIHYIDYKDEHLYKFSISDREKLIFVSKEEAEKLQLRLCRECREIENAYFND